MDKITFYCNYEKTIFRNEKNNYTIFTVKAENNMAQYENRFGNIVCKGNIPIYIKNMPLKISGNIYLNKRREYELFIETIKEEVHSEKVAIDYLTKSCHGVGEVTAKKIVDTLGYNIFSYTREKLKELINEEKTEELMKVLEMTVLQREIFEYISNYGCSYLDAIKIFKDLGPSALIEIKKNPYITKLPFSVKEKMALDLGITFFDEKRINGIVEEIFDKDLGHTYVDVEYLTDIVRYIETLSPYNTPIPIGLILNQIYKNSKKYVIEKGEPNKIFRKDLWISEKKIANNIRRLNNSIIKYDITENILDEVEKENKMTYDITQRETIKGILSSSGVKIMTGGPGTGKTTTINGAIKSYKKMFPNNKIILCAPTGRASQRMSEATEEEAKTIHRTVEYKVNDNVVTHLNEDEPLDADFIIVDEMSMTDVTIMDILLSAIKNNTLLLLVGDEDQLPSVGSGNVLHDIISSKKVEVYKLKRIFRQKEESVIVSNCFKIKDGEHELTTSKDFEIIKANTEQEIKKIIIEQINKYYKKDDPYYVQLLSPSKKGEVGVYNINKILQEHLNKENKKYVVYGNNIFKVNDKVILNHNNYDVENTYYNGDIGIITDIIDGCLFLNINDKQIFIEKEHLEDVSLSYDITIHKSQGSEYSVSIVVLPSTPQKMLQRKLLFTAVSRAKEKVVIIAQNDAIDKAIDNTSTNERKTTLSEKIIGIETEIINKRGIH